MRWAPMKRSVRVGGRATGQIAMLDAFLGVDTDAMLDLPPYRLASIAGGSIEAAVPYGAASETGVLRDVLLASPAHLEAVPCCAVTRASLRDGFTACRQTALRQHAALAYALREEGVRVVPVPAVEGLADLAFVRDAVTISPWGLIRLSPAAAHRRPEGEHVAQTAAMWGVPVISPDYEGGTIEGGDVCILRPGVVAIGTSGERTDARGARVLADLFEAQGWEVVLCPFDPHFLHLDTQFCLLDGGTALACRDVLSDCFLEAIDRLGITLLPATYKEVQALGCNVVSLGERRVVSAAHNARINGMMQDAGYRVIPVELDQFTRCGGGPHCLTMPLRRIG